MRKLVISKTLSLLCSEKAGVISPEAIRKSIRMVNVKKLINSPANCVDEHLEGFAAINPGVRILKGFRVIVRNDLQQFKTSGKVALVSGGGSGHEPVFAGYVGCGGLTAAVAGSVFTSPPPSDILAALKAVNNRGGTLVIVFNYTGDRLNFAIALERAAASRDKSNGPIRMVCVGEDCALTSKDKSAGRRGLAGGLLAIKIAGALAEEGKPLDYIASAFNEVVENMGTIGLAISSCSLPGSSGGIFYLGADEMELGLGVHGEPGVRRVKLQSAKDAIRTMLDHMTDPDSATSLDLSKGIDTGIAVLLNNLGSTTQIEMNILSRELILALGDRKLAVKRVWSGTFMTSLEMQGISVTLLKLNAERLRCLDAPANVPAWSCTKELQSTDRQEYSLNNIYAELDDLPNVKNTLGSSSTETSAKISDENSKLLINCIAAACESLITSEELLNALDRSSGDGDCGSTMRRAAEAVRREIASNEINRAASPANCPAALLNSIALVWEENSGGTSGALVSLLLSSMASKLTGGTSFDIWTSALASGVDAIQRYGNAAPGDRTMVDPLCAMVSYLQKHNGTQCDPTNILKELSEVATESANATKAMPARAGRSSYVAKENLTEADPGATAVAVCIKAISKAAATATNRS